MDTKKTPHEFSKLLDGRLSPAEEAAWRERIAADPKLAESFRIFSSGVQVVAASRRLEDLPPGFDARLRARLRTDELVRRAKAKAGTEASRRGDWWQRSAIAISGMAAGIAMMLALDPTGLWGGPSHVAVITSAPSASNQVVVGTLPDEARLSAREVRQLAAQKAVAVEEFDRAIRMHEWPLDPKMLRSEFQLFFRNPSPGLLSNARAYESELGDSMVGFLEELDRFCVLVERLDKGDSTTRIELSSHELLEMLNSLRQSTEFARGLRDDGTALTADELASSVSSHFAAGQYAEAASKALKFVSEFPESQHLGVVTRQGALSLHRSGKPVTALRLLDSVSAVYPTVLRGLTTTEIDNIRNSAIAPSGKMIQIAPQADGSRIIQSSPFGLQAVRDWEIVNLIARNLKALIVDLDPVEESARNVVNRQLAVIESDQTLTQNQQGSQARNFWWIPRNSQGQSNPTSQPETPPVSTQDASQSGK